MSLSQKLLSHNVITIQQRRELAELFGVETRNKYSILGEAGNEIGFAAEQQKGFLGILLRQLFGHWRSFEVLIFNSERALECTASHPFRFYYQQIDVCDPMGNRLGMIKRRFAILSKKFEIVDPVGQVLFSVSSPLWTVWTFSFMRHGRRVAEIKKQWAGFIQEVLTDAERFRVEFLAPELTATDRLLLVVSGVFIDLLYFERKAR